MDKDKQLIKERIEQNSAVIFASTEKEAEWLYNVAKSADPFPEIKPALLNSADIVDYIAATGMVHPFKPTIKSLKPASYEIAVGKEILYWTVDGKEVNKTELKDSDSIPFKKNSITYVTISPRFQIPDYIALRFNLCIKHVQRGLLLGTGPLVNPGFVGRIEIPIHNLTNNNYYIKPGEPLITVEFTKISPNSHWDKPDKEKSYNRQGVYVPNSKPKDLRPYEFVFNALPSNIDKVQSSIGKIISDTQKEIKISENNIKSVKDEHDKLIGKIQTFGGVGLFVLFVAIVTLFNQTKSVVSDANKYVADATNVYHTQIENTLQAKIDHRWEAEFGELKSVLETLNSELETLDQDVYKLKEKLVKIEVIESIQSSLDEQKIITSKLLNRIKKLEQKRQPSLPKGKNGTN